MAISEKTRKIIWIEAAGRCAICKEQVLTRGTGHDDLSVFGQEAHIVGKSSGGPRAGGLSLELIDHHSNLILLCSKHHKQIDDQPNDFTVDRLRKIKAYHAAWAAAFGDSGGRMRLVPDPSFPQPVVLTVVTRGNPLWMMIKQSIAFEYALPDHLPSGDEDLIIEFLDMIRDHLDVAHEIEGVHENREVEKVFQGYIGRLAERQFVVGASIRHMLLVDGRPGALAWPLLRVEVQSIAEAKFADVNGVPFTQADSSDGAGSSNNRMERSSQQSPSSPTLS